MATLELEIRTHWAWWVQPAIRLLVCAQFVMPKSLLKRCISNLGRGIRMYVGNKCVGNIYPLQVEL